MKLCKAFRILLALILIPAFCVFPDLSPAETAWETMKLPVAGVEIDFPPASELSGTLIPGYEVAPDIGVVYSEVQYFGIPKEKADFLFSRPGIPLTEDQWNLVDGACPALLEILCMEAGKTPEDLHPDLKEMLAPESFEELGTRGEHSYYIRYLPDLEETGRNLSAEAKVELEALVQSCREPGRIRIIEPEKTAGKLLKFETTDLEDHPAQSGELFGKSTLTMVNVWTTWCGPCIRELVSLENLSRRMKEKNVAVVGLVMDIRDREDSETILEAQQILRREGAEYMNLIPWEGIDSVLTVYSFPTSYFVDSAGRIVYEDSAGSQSSYEYEQTIDKILAEMEQKK